MDKTTDDIEREIERERVALSRSLDSLNRMFSRDALTDQAVAILRENGGDLTGAALRQIKANPMALALTGAGLAWLVTGSARVESARSVQNRPLRTPAPKVAYDQRRRPPAPGFRHTDSVESFEDRIARASDNEDDYDPAIRGGSDIDDDLINDTATVREGLIARLMEGTEFMTDTARDRVIAAREAAIAAERRLEARAREYGNASKDAFSSQPLVGALVAFGVGAVVGALLPRTRVEDENLSAYGARAKMEAERIYQAELAKLRAVADAATETARAAVEDVAETTGTKVEEAVDRVKTTAKTEAKKRDLGSSIN